MAVLPELGFPRIATQGTLYAGLILEEVFFVLDGNNFIRYLALFGH